jgi:hypothetical protein
VPSKCQDGRNIFLNDKTDVCADWQKAVDFGDTLAAADMDKFCNR